MDRKYKDKKEIVKHKLKMQTQSTWHFYLSTFSPQHSHLNLFSFLSIRPLFLYISLSVCLLSLKICLSIRPLFLYIYFSICPLFLYTCLSICPLFLTSVSFSMFINTILSLSITFFTIIFLVCLSNFTFFSIFLIFFLRRFFIFLFSTLSLVW